MATIKTTIKETGKRLRRIELEHWGGNDSIVMLLKTGYEIDNLIADFEDAIYKLKETNDQRIKESDCE